MSPWETLVARYADGRKVCNCRQAYYSVMAGSLVRGCEYGCQANQHAVKDVIAARVLEELHRLDSLLD